jgi:FkbM family methyltransferase
MKFNKIPQNSVLKTAQLIEKAAAYLQGKGYGSSSIQQENRLVRRLLARQPKFAVDIGGNVGSYSAELRKYYPEMEIHIFEPSQKNVEQLNTRFADDSLIKINPVAVSDKTGNAVLFSDEPGSGMGSLVQRNLDHLEIEFEVMENVQTVRFEDYWVNILQRCELDIVKMDIEGYELSALMGFGDAILHTKLVQFEFGGCNVDTRAYFRDFFSFFVGNKFKIYRITPIGLQYLECYRESDEFFSTTNYIAVSQK